MMVAVSGRNVTLGVFPDMVTAVKSLNMTRGCSPLFQGVGYQEWLALHPDRHDEILTVIEIVFSPVPSPLFS